MLSTPVTFKNRDGYKLFGIFEQPDEKASKLSVLLLSPGIKMRVGPHRLYNKLSKLLVDRGFNVFRFDFYGLGDSEGTIDEPVLVNVYNSIQDGRYVNDTTDAMNWLEEHHGQTEFILGGLCGGAITGLLAGAGDRRVSGLLALGLINVFEGGEDNFSKFVTDGQLSSLKRGYINKLSDPDSWKRLLTFKSDYRAITKIVTKPFRMIVKRAKTHLQRDQDLSEETLPKELQGSNVNPKFAPAFFRMLKDAKKLLLVYSGADRLLWEYNEKFEAIYKSKLKSYRSYFKVVTIPEANHILSMKDWEEEMHRLVLDWIDNNYKKE
jgi:pimeloyl-ACP methyl ester carboxylesterase